MKVYKLLFCSWVVALFALQGCTKGIVEDDVPAEYRNALHIGTVYAEARELFYNKICGINYEGEPLSNYVQQVAAIQSGDEVVSSLAADPVLEKIHEEGLPDNELWRYTINLADEATYSTPNNGWLFVKAEFDKDNSMNPSYVDLDADGRCTQVKLPVDIKRLVVAIAFSGDYSENWNNEVVENIDGAPALGLPGDFSVPRRYLVQNKWEREDGTHIQRVVEIRVQYASSPKY